MARLLQQIMNRTLFCKENARRSTFDKSLRTPAIPAKGMKRRAKSRRDDGRLSIKLFGKRSMKKARPTRSYEPAKALWGRRLTLGRRQCKRSAEQAQRKRPPVESQVDQDSGNCAGGLRFIAEVLADDWPRRWRKKKSAINADSVAEWDITRPRKYDGGQARF